MMVSVGLCGVVSNGRMTDQLERILIDSRGLIEALSRHLLVTTEENDENLSQDRRCPG
jgi:hypothetical protein